MIYHPTISQSSEGFNCDYAIKLDILIFFTTVQQLKVLETLKKRRQFWHIQKKKKILANANEDSC